jgi:hypothetical protein
VGAATVRVTVPVEGLHVAVMVAATGLETALVVTEKVAVVAPATTGTLPGTWADELLLDRNTQGLGCSPHRNAGIAHLSGEVEGPHCRRYPSDPAGAAVE